MPFDVPNSAGSVAQQKEFYLKEILRVYPERANDPNLIYGNVELEYLRLVNDGIIESGIPDRLSDTELKRTFTNIADRPVSVKNEGASGNNLDDDTAAIQTAVDKGGKIVFPRGVYRTTSPITVPGNASIELEGPATRVVAGAPFAGAMFKTQDSFVRSIGFSGGGIIDCAENADIGIHGIWFAHLRISDIRIDNAKVNGIKLGSSSAGGRSAEAVIKGVHVLRLGSSIPTSNNWGIFTENSGDHSISNTVIQSYRNGVFLSSGTTSLVDVHVWADPALGTHDTSFEDNGNSNSYVNCYADTPMSYGFRLRQFNSTLLGNQIYLNPQYANDNIVRGIRFEQTGPFASVGFTKFTGGDATHRMAVDSEVNGNDHSFIDYASNQWNSVVTMNAYNRARVSRVRDLQLVDKGSLPAASSNLRGQINAVRGSAGVADRLYICRKNATDAYEWAPLD